MTIEMEPIGFVSTSAETIPRSWSVSDVKGKLVIDESYVGGLGDIKPGQRIYVIFHFHKSPDFTSQFMRIRPPNREEKVGVSVLIHQSDPTPSAYHFWKCLE